MLVVPREVFDAQGAFQGVALNTNDYLEAFFKPGVAQFIDRELAEDSPEYKQLIAYALFMYEGKVLAYARTNKGGEARLHDKLSVGIGGHINPIDGIAESIRTYEEGVEREIREELSFEGSAKQRIFALINVYRNAVGKVHLGGRHLFVLSRHQCSTYVGALAQMAFYSLEELQGSLYKRLESWSAICVDALAGQA